LPVAGTGASRGRGEYDMPKQVIVRDKYTPAAYHVFTQADDNGTEWVRWTLGSPSRDFPDVLPLQQVVYGKVYEGKSFVAANTTGGDGPSGKSGTWTAYINHLWTMYYRKATDAGYLEWTIPAGHNRIQVMYNSWSNGSVIDFTLDGSTADLTVTSIDTAGITRVKEVVVATDADNGSERTFRITQDTTDTNLNSYIYGIRTFNTNAIGDPSTASSGRAVGHDMLTTVDNDDATYIVGNASGMYFKAEAGVSWQAMYRNTCELTMRWKPAAEEVYDWTGYGAHYNGYPFTITQTPTLKIDSVLVGESTSNGDMSDESEIPKGRLYSGDLISIIVQGNGVYDSGEHEEPEITIEQLFSSAGFKANMQIDWVGDADVSTLYSPSVLIPFEDTGTFVVPGDETEYDATADYSVAAQEMTYSPDSKPYKIRAESSASINEIVKSSISGKNKMYFKHDFSEFDGGMEPSSGDTWEFSAEVEIYKTVVDIETSDDLDSLNDSDVIANIVNDIDMTGAGSAIQCFRLNDELYIGNIAVDDIITGQSGASGTVLAITDTYNITVKLADAEMPFEGGEEIVEDPTQTTVVFSTAPYDGSVTTSWEPIEGFTGNIIGNGHKITNLTVHIPGLDNVGLFDALTGNIIVEDLRIEGDITGGSYVGLLAGDIDDTVSISKCAFIGTCTGETYVGGAYGDDEAGCNVDNCYCDVDITASGDYAGGFAASINGTVDACHASGDVTGVGDNVDGFCGAQDAGATVTGCKYLSDSHVVEADGVTGLTSEEMKQASSFDGWDFQDVWYEGTEYPELVVFRPSGNRNIFNQINPFFIFRQRG
jgi:hypothetical protein